MPHDPLPFVELVQAFLWTCDECGRDNFERAVTLAPETIDLREFEFESQEDADEVAAWLQDGGEGDWVTMPNPVTCEHCGMTYLTMDPD